MSEFPVDVIRSKRRKRTVQASLRDGRIKVMIPDDMGLEEETKVVDELTTRIIRRATSRNIDLGERARELASRYRLPIPTDVMWSDQQMQRWGSCSPQQGRIRISSRLVSMPAWVLDSVLVHEMAHLTVTDHGPRFQEMVDRYEFSERAKGYLMAISEGRAS